MSGETGREGSEAPEDLAAALKRVAARSHRLSLIIVGVFALLIIGGESAADRLWPARGYYGVATYEARFWVTPATGGVIAAPEPDLEALKAERLKPGDLNVSARVVIERPVPVSGRYRLSSGQASPEAIALAGPELTARVSLLDQTLRTDLPDETARQVLDAFAADVLAQSGSAEYAAAVRAGGVTGPPVPLLYRSLARFWISTGAVVAVAFGATVVGMLTVRRRVRAILGAVPGEDG